MSIQDEARAEAERRWPSYPTVGFSGAEDRQAAFIAGAEWQASRQPEAAPSVATRYEPCVLGADGECSRWSHDHTAASQPEAAPATPVSDTDEVFAILDELNASNQIGYDDYSRLHDAVSRASQPVQVEVTDDMVERAAKAMDENFNPDRYPIMAAMFKDYAQVALEAALGGGETNG